MKAVRSPLRWKSVAVFCLVLAGLATATYWACGPVASSAQSPIPSISPAQEQAIEHASALSEAFRAASNRVMPAVVSIQHEIRSIGPTWASAFSR